MSKPLIYVASPYTKGDATVNTRFQLRVFDLLIREGKVVPIVPLWSHFQHIFYPLPYEMWMEYDHALIERVDGVLRLDAQDKEYNNYLVKESSGADREVQHARGLGLPVFHSIKEMYSWCAQRPDHS